VNDFPIIALALVAGAASAVDVSSMIHIDGDALNVTTEGDGSVKFLELSEYDPSGDSDYLWKLSASGDNFGAEIWSWSFIDTNDDGKNDTADAAVSSKKIWFSPLDFLKVTVGNVGGQSIANPQFGWWAQSANNYAYGYQAELTFGSLAAKIALEPGAGNYWIDPSATRKVIDVDDVSTTPLNEEVSHQKDGAIIGYKLGGTWIDVTYNLGDFGTVQGVVTINGTIGAHGFSNWATSPLAFGVAYNKMPFGATGFYGDAFVSFKYDDHSDDDNLVFQGVDSQIGGQVVLGAITIRETNLIQYRDEFKFGFEARAEYAAGSFTPYVNVEGYDIMDSKLNINLGAGTSVGSVSIDASVAIPLEFSDGYSFSFSVPVQFSLAL
jgi:hypothetical protein